jgi:hypothetical protein
LRKLEDIEVEEISLVAVPATRKQFYIIKRSEEMDYPELEEFKKSYKSVFGEDLTEEQIAKAKELPKDALNAIKSAAATLEKYKDDFEADLMAALKTLTKYSSYGYPAKKSDEETTKEFIAELTDVEKAGKRLSKATREDLEKAIGILKAMLKEDDADLKKGDLKNLPPEAAAEIVRLRKIEADMKKSAKEAADKKALEDIEAKIAKDFEEKYGLKPKQVKKTGLDPDDPTPKPEPEPKGSDEYQKRLEKSGKKVLWGSLISQGGQDEN